MKTPAVAAFLLVAMLTTTVVIAEQYPSLPIYPHTNKGGTAKEPSNEKAVNQAVIGGSTAGLYTSDSPQTVDRWYARKLPKACKRIATEGLAYQYTCGNQAVTIAKNEGQTYIVLGPKP